MIKIEHILVSGWESAIRGMRNPMNSWEKSDSRRVAADPPFYQVGDEDLKLKTKNIGGR